MAMVPEAVAESEGSQLLTALGYPQLYCGKVGELFEVPGQPEQLLMYRSPRISIFDQVMPRLVPRKGEVLTALTQYWLTKVLADIPNHLLAWGGAENLWVEAGWNMDEVLKLPLESTLLVRRGEVWPYEMIFRGHLGGSVWGDYELTGTVVGVRVQAGLSKWQKLPIPLFTPTTKAEGGHDVKLSLDEYPDEETNTNGGTLSAICLHAYMRAYKHAKQRSVLLLDTKFEGIRVAGQVMLADEVLTPDSSRYTTPEDLEVAIAEGRDPAFLDKEPVRVWGKGVETPWGLGLQKLDPENMEHLAFVAGLKVPDMVVSETTARYLEIVERITTKSLDVYQVEDMQIPVL